MPVGRAIAGNLSIQPGHMSNIIRIDGIDPSIQLQLVYNTTNPGTASNTLEIPVQAGVQDYSIDWGDGHVIDYTTGGIKSHIYTDGDGIKNVKIFGICFGLQYGVAFDTTNDRQKLINIVQWGTDLAWVTLNGAFSGCINTVITAVDVPDWTAVTDASFAFALCENITTIAANLPTSNIVTFISTFESIGVTSFPVLNFSSATNMTSTWEACLNLTTFPSLAYPLVTTFELAWFDCILLTDWGAPLSTPPNLTSLLNTYGNCALTSYPLWSTGLITTVSGAWRACNFGAFPLLDLSNCLDFEGAWFSCATLGFLGEEFPFIDFSSGTNLKETFRNAGNLNMPFAPNFNAMTDGTACFTASPALDCEDYSLLLLELATSNPNNDVVFGADGFSNTVLAQGAKNGLEARIPPWVITDGNSICTLLWFDDGTGSIANPWNDNDIWMD